MYLGVETAEALAKYTNEAEVLNMDILTRRLKGGTRKIGDAPPRPCQDPEHNPPGMMVYEPGVYEHTCPACGNTVIFTKREAYL